MAPPNVIVFGGSGVGKSSVINMLMGAERAATSPDAQGCTFESTPYTVDIAGSQITLHDTAGLNEVTTVIPKDAVANVFKLMTNLDTGVSLLVYVIRGPRLMDFTVKNYKMFHDIFCQSKVPIVLAVTGLEAEVPIDEWWVRNKGVFEQHGMHFRDQACITASKGKWKERASMYAYEEEYEESVKKLRSLVHGNLRSEPWRVPRVRWFKGVIGAILQLFSKLWGWPSTTYITILCEALTQLYVDSLRRRRGSWATRSRLGRIKLDMSDNTWDNDIIRIWSVTISRTHVAPTLLVLLRVSSLCLI